jgi:DNA-binding MarR family transcriptional regulator
MWPVAKSRFPSPLRQALSRYVDARSSALAEARRTLNIGEGDARAVLFIADNPGTRPTQLRDYLGITSAGVTALIDRLVERGAVRRDVDPEDRRVSRITLTIDLSADPWSSLTRFDEDFEGAVAAGDLQQAQQLAEILESLTESTVGSTR